jgi:sRNA-binding protein
MIYQFSRDDIEATIRQLVNTYPKCFFDDPHRRLPLKKSIADDLRMDGFCAAYELMKAAIERYESHFAYQYGLQTGRKRIDLNGKEVDTVTKQEYLNAQKKIKEDQKKLTERNVGNPVTVTKSLHSSGRISDHQMGNVDARLLPGNADQLRKVKEERVDTAKVATNEGSVAPEMKVSPELTHVYEALLAANSAMSGTLNDQLRLALASAALGVVVKEAQRAIANFSENVSEVTHAA